MTKKIIITAGPNGAGIGAVIRRGFTAGLRNLEHAYKAAVDTWAEFDNVGEEPTLLQWGENP